MEKILIPLDGSEHSEEALSWAMDYAKRAGAQLILLRAVPVPLVSPSIWQSIEFVDALEKEVKETQRELRSRAAHLAEHGFMAQSRVVEKNPVEAILEVAEEEGVDLIVLTTHGRSGPSRWLMGSVAEKVVRHAPCAVVSLTPSAIEARRKTRT